MIESLIIKDEREDFKRFIEEGKKEKELQLKKVNIFVGENNSGKSYFMRELFKSFRYKEIKDLKDNYNKPFNQFQSIDISYINSMKAKNEFDNIFSSADLEEKKQKVFIKKLFNFHKNYFLNNDNEVILYNDYIEILENSRILGDGVVTETHNNYELFIMDKTKELKMVSYSSYIPILRNLKKIYQGDKDLLMKRITNDYFHSNDKDIEKEELNILSGENLFSKIKTSLLSYSSEREKIRNYESFLRAFFNNKVELIPREKDDKGYSNSIDNLYVKIGEEKDKPIQNLGDGIQALILITHPLFMNNDKNHIIFIEEPEMNLHPGFQRIFLELISSDRFPNTQIFITTHSNHFLDIAIENSENISVHSFQKLNNNDDTDVKFQIQDITERSSQALDLLGVRTSSVFLSNCTIWVEGISDRIYIRHYIKMFVESDEFSGNKIYKEDIHYSFVEYSGNNLTHWSFFDDEDEDNPNINYESISKNVMIIADLDNNKGEKHNMLKAKMGDNYCVLPRREIENLLSKEVLKKTIMGYQKEKGKLHPINFEDYKNERIGNYIGNQIIEEKHFKAFLTSPNSGKNRFIRNKREFANNAIKQINNWNDLSKEAKELTRKVYTFIDIQQNKNKMKY